MGSCPRVDIWVGVREPDHNIEEIINKLPRDLFDEEGDPKWLSDDKKILVEKYGLTIDFFYCSEELAGVGVTIFAHDWDYGVVPFDAMAIQHKIERARVVLQTLFNDCGIDVIVDTWCQTDYR